VKIVIHDIPKPELSEDFTLEDIRKIREWDYERLKDATTEEIIADSRERTAEALARMEELRNRSLLV